MSKVCQIIKAQITLKNLLYPKDVKLSGHQITSLLENQIMVTPKYIIVLKVAINGLTLYNP